MSNRSSRKKKFSPPRDIPETQKMAEKLASEIEGAKPEDFRYAEYRFHDGQHWTVRACWEQCVDRELREVSSAINSHSSPPPGFRSDDSELSCWA